MNNLTNTHTGRDDQQDSKRLLFIGWAAPFTSKEYRECLQRIIEGEIERDEHQGGQAQEHGDQPFEDGGDKGPENSSVGKDESGFRFRQQQPYRPYDRRTETT